MPLQIVATDSNSGAVLTYSATQLPTGIGINSSTGLISGTPSATGTFNTVVTATDQFGTSGSAAFVWTIVPVSGNTVTVTNPGSQSGQTGQSPNLQMAATDSQTGQTFTWSATALPTGMTIGASTGLISGTLTAAGTFNCQVKAIDTTGAFGTANFTWTVTTPGSTIVARVGNAIPNQSFATGCYNAGFGPKGPSQNQEGADTFFVQNVNRPVGGSHLKVTKKFWNGGNNPGDNGDYHLSGNWNNMQNYANHGTRVIACIQPACPPGLNARDPSGTPCNFTTSSQCTAAQKTTCLNEVQNIITWCTALRGMGFTSTTLRIVLYQEPADANRNGQVNGVKMTPIDYGNVWRTYGPVIQTNAQCFGADGKPFPLISNTNFVGGGPVSNTTDYANAALGRNPGGGNANPPTNVTLLGLAVDFYSNSYYKAHTGPSWQINKTLTTTDANGESLSSIADSLGIAFGLHEFGDVPLTYDPGGAPWTFNLAFLNYLQTFMVARINAGKPNLDCIYYQSQCSPTGAGDIASPICQDPGTGSLIGSSPENHYNDFRVAWYQGFYDAVNGN